MQKLVTVLGSFWAAAALVTLIFGTMVEPVRHHIEEATITTHLMQWFLVLLPGIILAVVSLRSSPESH